MGNPGLCVLLDVLREVPGFVFSQGHSALPFGLIPIKRQCFEKCRFTSMGHTADLLLPENKNLSDQMIGI